MNANQNTYVIASSRSWYQSLPEQLQEKLDDKFVLIKEKNELKYDLLKKIAPKYIFFPHWSHIIPMEIYQNFECIMFHMTDLPFGRGGSPLQNLIIRGITETKISAFRCVEEVDAGPIYFKSNFTLDGTAEEIFQRLTEVISEMILRIIKTNPQPIPQTGTVEQFVRRKPEESKLVPGKTTEQYFDFIRMLDSDEYPRAFFEFGDVKLEFYEAKLQQGQLTAKVKFINSKKEKNHE